MICSKEMVLFNQQTKEIKGPWQIFLKPNQNTIVNSNN